MRTPKEIQDAIFEMQVLLGEINSEMNEKRKLASFINNPREVQELYMRQWWCMSKIEALRWVMKDPTLVTNSDKKQLCNS